LREPLRLRLRIRSLLAQEIAMALFDPVSITREIEATPLTKNF
jgi:hypothetical protein